MIKRYLNSIKNAVFKPLRCIDYPMHIYIEPSTACNINCVMCDRAKLIKHPKFMPLEKFKEIVDEIKPKFINFSGYGEPLLAPNFFEMVSYARSKGINIVTTTNGVCFEGNIQKILDSKINALGISLDAATEKTYKKIRRNDNFPKIIKNIKLLTSSRKNNFPFVKLEFVIMGWNKNEILDFVKLTKQAGADAIRFQMYTQVDETHRRKLIGNLNPDELENIFRTGKKLANQLKIKTNFKSLLSEINELKINYQAKKINSPKKCLMPWISINITVDGDIWPCCQLMTRDCVMGNIYKQSISEIWNNQKMQRFRNQIRQGHKPHLLCQMCIPRSLFDLIKGRLFGS